MPRFTLLFLLPVFLLNIQVAGAQSRKVIFNENVIVPSNFLQYDTTIKWGNGLRARADDQLVYIAWQTLTETNTSHFELQRSVDGGHFEPIETITAVGLSTSTNTYKTIDEKAGITGETLYYRVKAVFINGKEMITTALAVTLLPQSPLSVYTQP